MKNFEESKKEFENFYKVDTTVGGGLVKVWLFNPTTNEERDVIVDDMEYQYMEGFTSREYCPEFLEYLRYHLNINEEVKNKYLDFKKIFRVGSKVKIIKGRKEKGNRGTVKKLWDYYDRYNRWVALYSIVETVDGKEVKINTNNLEIV